MMLLAELLLMELLLVGLLFLGSSTQVVCQSLLNHQAKGVFTYSCKSIAALGLISAAFPARLRAFQKIMLSKDDTLVLTSKKVNNK